MLPPSRYLLSVVILAAGCLAIAAGPSAGELTDDLIRRANVAFLHGDADDAERLYASAEERTGDPGLVAFNKAAVHFQRGEFPAAEVHYARVLDDKACPPERAARAWFNRGTCLLRRGGNAGVYRSAIACFDRCLDSPAADEPLKADARHNVEIAKLLWIEANKKAAKPESPNVPPPEEQPEPPPSRGGPEPMNTVDSGPGKTDTLPAPSTTQAPVSKGQTPTETNAKTAGNNRALQPLANDDQVQPLSPDETREYLRRTDERLRDERRRMLRLLYGPDRPGVRDW